MRCNRPKPVFGIFHLLCGLLMVSVVIGINAISSVEAVTEIGPGDRIFFLGNQWVKNRTVSQTGFEVIRLSSTEPAFRMRYVRDTLNLKLMVGLGGTVVPDDRPSPEGERAPWPGDTMDTALSAFRDSLANWLGRDRLDISAFHFNLEYNEEYYTYRYPDDPNDLAASKIKRVNALTDTMTLILKNYQRTIHEVCDSLSIDSYPKLWVFSAKGTIQNPIIFQSSFRADGTDPTGEGWQSAIKVRNEETGDIEYVSTVYNYSKDDWGGIRNEGGTLTLQNCVISDAEVGVEVTSYQGKTTISETDLSANHFGMKVHEGASATQLELTNVGLYQSRKGIVAGLYGTGHVQLTNATIADNYQGVEFVEDGDSPTMQLKNTIVAFNEKGVYTQGINSGSSPKKRTIGVTLRYCDVYGSSEADFQGVYTAMPTVGSTGNVSVDPKFVVHASDTSEENDYHLQASSPLIDAGDPSMTEADESTINMGRYGGTTEYTSVFSGGESSTKPVVLKTEDTPLVFSLSQNAPNPFNPETIISYSLPQSEQVKLVIYNVLGQEIRTLVNAFKPAGRYRVVWNSKDDFGRSVSSGIYFYQITAGEFLDTRKMLILK